MISVEDKEKFERNTDYEIWNSDSSEAEDESQSNRELRKHVYKWIAMCLRGGDYYYIVAMYNNQKIQYDVARLYNTVVQLIGKVGTHEANRRVQRVHRATMEPNETLIQFISRLQYMAERAAEIIKANGDPDFSFSSTAIQGIIIENAIQHPVYQEHMMKLMRDKPNLSLGEMLKELKGWLNQLDDFKPAATRRSQESQR